MADGRRRYAEAAAELPTRDGLTVAVRHTDGRSGTETVVERYVDGRLIGLDGDDDGPVDLVIEHRRGLAWPVPVAEDANPRLADFLIGTDRASSPMPPLDVVREPRFGDLRQVPYASTLVQTRFGGSPLGTASVWLRFVDGLLDHLELGEAARPDVGIELRYLDLLRLRLGEIGMVDAVVRGQVAGRFSHLNLVAGLFESDELRAALRSYATADLPLLRWTVIQLSAPVLSLRQTLSTEAA